MKKRFFAFLKERVFLLVVVFLYSILAFINLGNFDAPQTFEEFNVGEKFIIVLPKAEKVSSVMFYTGTTLNDFKSFYQVRRSEETCETCESRNEHLEINPSEFSAEKSFNVDGPFQWVRLKIEQSVSMISILANKNREISIGEVAVFNDENEKIDGIRVFKTNGGSLFDENEISTLTDESEEVQNEITAMNSMIFDELYFGQTAYQFVHELEGYENVHPPLGKILQAIPILIFGKMSPFTWRLMGTIAGILVLVAGYFLALEIFKKKYFANIAVTLLSLSSLHFTQTRVGTVDSYLCLFTILSFLFMFRLLNHPKEKKSFALSGLFFGCAVSVKWSGMFGGIGLLILFLIYLRKNKFFEQKKRKELGFWVLRGALFFVFIPLVIYCGSYLLFPKTTNANSLVDVYEQGAHLFSYHAGEIEPHESASPWFTWPISLVGFPFYASEDGTKTISLFGNYVLAYISVIALLITVYFAVKKRDKTSIYLLIAYLSLLLPYAFIKRPMFLYHYLSASVFAILAVVNMLKNFPESKFLVRLVIISSLVSFIALYPKMTGI